MDEKIKGVITNIQHFCYQDGPGVRTTVFLKGCNLSCKWCANPENINSNIFEEHNQDSIGTLTLGGRIADVDQVLEEVMGDSIYYLNSGGGITVSGGEPLLQAEFTKALFQEAHKKGLTTAIETAGNVPWETFASVISEADYVLHDIKLMDATLHKKWTGVDNQRILANFQQAYETFKDKTFIARTPLISGVNATEDNILKTLEFIGPHKNVEKYELLPYHKFGLGKYDQIGKDYELSDLESPDTKLVESLRKIIDDYFIAR